MAADSGRRRFVATVLISVLLVLATLFLAESPASSDKDESYDSQVTRLFDKVSSEVAKMRDLPPPASTELNIVSTQWFIDQEQTKVREERRKISLEDIVYKALFLMPQNYSVAESRVAQADDVISAVVGRKLYVVKENFNPKETRGAVRTLAHEITHLLQNRFNPPSITTFDQRQAWIALIEGDADFTADKYAAKSTLSLYEVSVPRSLDRIKRFPYVYGRGFVEALYKAEGGWSLVNSAYTRPPRSTEEILHPDVYLSGGSFKKVDALSPESTGWVRLWSNTMGENFIQVMLENSLSGEESARAAAGWGGDNLTLLSRGGGYLVTFRINWDTEKDASEFYEAYGKTIMNMGGREADSGLYYLQNHYVAFAKHGTVIEIVSATDKESVPRLSQR